MNFAVLFMNPNLATKPHWFIIQRQLYQKYAVKDIWLSPKDYTQYMKSPWQGAVDEILETSQDTIAEIATEIAQQWSEHHLKPLAITQHHIHLLEWSDSLKSYTWGENVLYHPVSPLSISMEQETYFDLNTEHFTWAGFEDLSSTERSNAHEFYYLLIQQQKLDQTVDHPSDITHHYHVQLQLFNAHHESLSELYQINTS